MTDRFLSNFYKEYGYESEKFEALNQFYVKLGTDLLNLAASSNSSSYLGSVETYKYIPAQYIDIKRARYRVRDIVESYEFNEAIQGHQAIDKQAAWLEMSAKNKASILDKVGRFIELNGIYPGTEDIVERADVLGFEVFSEYGRQLIRNVDYYYNKNRFYLLKTDKLPMGSEHLIFKDIAIDVNMPERKFVDKIKIPYNSTLTKNEYNEMAYALIRIALGGFTVGNLNKALSFIGEAEGGVFAYDRLTAPENKKHLWGDEPGNDDPYKHLRSPLTRFDFVVSAPIGEEGTRRMDIVRAFMNRLRLKHTSFVIIPRMSLLDEYDLGMMDDDLFMKLFWRPWDELDAQEDIDGITYGIFLGDGISARGDTWCISNGLRASYDSESTYDSNWGYDSHSSAGFCSDGNVCSADDHVPAEHSDSGINPWCQIAAEESIGISSSFNIMIDRLALYRDILTLSAGGMEITDIITAEEAIRGSAKYISSLVDGFSVGVPGTDISELSYDNYFTFDSDWPYDSEGHGSPSTNKDGDNQFEVAESVVGKAHRFIDTLWDVVYSEDIEIDQGFGMFTDYLDVSESVNQIMKGHHNDELDAEEIHNISMAFINLVATISAREDIRAKVTEEYGENATVFDYLKTGLKVLTADGFSATSNVGLYDIDSSVFDMGTLFDVISETGVLEQFLVGDEITTPSPFGKGAREMYNKIERTPDALDEIEEAEDVGITVRIIDKETGEEREVDL